MIHTDAISQPTLGSTLEAVEKILLNKPVSHIDVAAAYVTIGGARDLISSMRSCLGDNWPIVQKRWLISFDYCRSEPLAVRMLVNLPSSNVKVYDVERVLRQKCTPAIPFHPKTFIVRGKARRSVLAGSGNISRSGLNTGFEAGLVLEVSDPANGQGIGAAETLKKVQKWYNLTWQNTPELSNDLLSQYKDIYESEKRLRSPTPTEDDTAPAIQGKSALSPEDLVKLRVCRHLWIEAGNITKNLGPHRPGNQLMMKRMSRVFFGVPPYNVPQNSPLTKIGISFGSFTKDDCSLTFSDNGMDKLTLPLPNAGGPQKYDNENLLFTRTGAQAFDLRIGTASQRNRWLARSQAISGLYSMSPSGRQWGIF